MSLITADPTKMEAETDAERLIDEEISGEISVDGSVPENQNGSRSKLLEASVFMLCFAFMFNGK